MCFAIMPPSKKRPAAAEVHVEEEAEPVKPLKGMAAIAALKPDEPLGKNGHAALTYELKKFEQQGWSYPLQQYK